MASEPVVICEETWCDGDVKDRTVFRVDDPATEGPRAHFSAQSLWVRSPNEVTPAGVWETDPEAGINIPRDALPTLALALLPHLTGDELRRVAEAMPRVAGEWEHRERWGSRVFIHRATESADAADWAFYENVYQALDAYASGWTQEAPCEACTYVGPATVQTWHPTARAAQAACDARLEAAGVRLCGEVVRDG